MARADARIIAVDGVFYAFDRTRDKFLSTSRAYLRAGVSSRKVTNQYLRGEDGQPLMSVGDLMPRNGTIVGITANCESASTWTVEIYRKGSPAPLATLAISASTQGQNTLLDVDILAGDIILVKANGINIPMPRTLIEIAWRL